MLYDKDRLFDEKGYSFIVSHNLKGNKIDDWVKQFYENENYRKLKRENSVILTHEIISFHKDDAKNITLEKLEDIARQYVRERNEKGMYIAVPHFDKEHFHIHICASGIEYKSGIAMRLSKPQLLKVKKNIQEYQLEKYPELSKSIVDHSKEKKVQALSDKEYQYKLRTGRATDKEHLIGILKTCYKKADSKEDFYKYINECGLTTYIRGGKISGLTYNNKKFRINRLGFTEERLEELNKTFNRNKDLSHTRKKSKEKIINRNR